MRMDEQEVAISILDRTYHVKCPASEVKQLQASAKLVDDQMRKLRNGSNIISAERLAIVAALNIAQEMMQMRNQNHCYMDVMTSQVKSMQDRIQAFLSVNDEVLV